MSVPILFLLAGLSPWLHAEGEQQFVDIGDLRLQAGGTLKECRVGYRTYGKLSPQKDNAILVPTWYLGTSGDLQGMIHSLVNTNKYCAITVDALTNGVSTSPSNSPTQGDAIFPQVSIRDMVESQHELLKKLGIPHLKAVTGISMGGIQTFQWLAAYPDFMDKAIPIVGSPRPSSYDLLFYGSGIRALEAAIADGRAKDDLLRAFADYFMISLETPTYFVKNLKREDAPGAFAGFESSILKRDPYDMKAGLQAIYEQDIFKPFGESEAQTAAAIKARVLVISASQDHCVNPTPALDFAKVLGAQTLVLTDDAGHQSPGAEIGKVSAAIDRFLAEP